MTAAELVQEALDNTTKRMFKVLDEAEANGWDAPVVSVCVRLTKGKPANPRAAKRKLICPGCNSSELVNGRQLCAACTVSGVIVTPEPEEPPALPFFATWLLKGWTKGGKGSWSFDCARASNGQALSEDDILTYLNDPSVIYPEPPEGETE